MCSTVLIKPFALDKSDSYLVINSASALQEYVYKGFFNTTIFSFKLKVATNARETVTAFTEDDLKSFYYNPALVYVEDSIEDFIKVNIKHCFTLEKQFEIFL
jgi:hypothetical protein